MVRYIIALAWSRETQITAVQYSHKSVVRNKRPQAERQWGEVDQKRVPLLCFP